MIAGIFHDGSGIGNQLHRYVATRVLALDKGYDWYMVNQTRCKFKDFMSVRFPAKVGGFNHRYDEKKIIEDWVDIRGYDPEFNFVEDDTVIDGEFQDERYWEHREKNVRDWLRVEPIDMPDDVCVINFRGGEYTMFPDLFLPIDYWNEAIYMMLDINPNMKFEVHTDDPATARLMFEGYPVIHNPGINWRSIRYAKYLILSNSSFGILPAWLNQDLKHPAIAPRYWARRNTKKWALPQNYYKRFMYI